jgi:hypothetical protein
MLHFPYCEHGLLGIAPGESAHNCEDSSKDLMVRRKRDDLRKIRINTRPRLEW